MKILVTGGSGFIGSNFIINQIKKENNIILNFDKLTYAGNSSNLVSIENESSYTFVNGDICDLKSVEKVFSDFLPDALVHFAAESHVDRSIENPLEFYQY